MRILHRAKPGVRQVAEREGQLIYTTRRPRRAHERSDPDRGRLPRLPSPEMRRALRPADRTGDFALRFQDVERAVRVLGGLRGAGPKTRKQPHAQ